MVRLGLRTWPRPQAWPHSCVVSDCRSSELVQPAPYLSTIWLEGLIRMSASKRWPREFHHAQVTPRLLTRLPQPTMLRPSERTHTFVPFFTATPGDRVVVPRYSELARGVPLSPQASRPLRMLVMPAWICFSAAALSNRLGVPPAW